jgi:hypothetical protein
MTDTTEVATITSEYRKRLTGLEKLLKTVELDPAAVEPPPVEPAPVEPAVPEPKPAKPASGKAKKK